MSGDVKARYLTVSPVMLAGREWEACDDGEGSAREHGDVTLATARSHRMAREPVRWWGLIHLPGHTIETPETFRAEEEAAASVIALARQLATDMLAAAGES